MRMLSKGRRGLRKLSVTLFCFGNIVLGMAMCGYSRGMPPSYNQYFNSSSGQCQGQNAAPVAGEQTLTLAALNGPNITICILRASDGTLLRHYDLPVHGALVGSGDGQLYIDERDGTGGASSALCSIQIDSGITRWCQTQVTGITSVTVANGSLYALAAGQPGGVDSLTVLSEHDGRVFWSVRMQSNPYASTRTALALGQGMVYLTAYNSQDVTPGTVQLTDSVCAYQANSGQRIWCNAVSAQTIDGMVVSGDRLYLAANIEANNSSDPELMTFGASNGQAIENVGLPGFQGADGLSQFFIAQGMIFIDARSSRPPYADFIDVLRLDGKSVLWSDQTSRLNSLLVWNNHLYTIAIDGKIEAHNLLDIYSTWSYTVPSFTGAPSAISPPAGTFLATTDMLYAVVNQQAYYTIASNLLALRASNGALVWQDQECAGSTNSGAASTPTASAGQPGTGSHCYWQPGRSDFTNSYGRQQGYRPVVLLQLGS